MQLRDRELNKVFLTSVKSCSVIAPLICLVISLSIRSVPYFNARFELILNEISFSRLVHPHKPSSVDLPKEMPPIAVQYLVYKGVVFLGAITPDGTFDPIDEIVNSDLRSDINHQIRFNRRASSLRAFQVAFCILTGIGLVCRIFRPCKWVSS